MADPPHALPCSPDDGKGHPVALLGIGEATLTHIRQSAEVDTPVGKAVFKLTAGGHRTPGPRPAGTSASRACG
ncbi:DUF6230 family protein [Streptomyces sp. NPDC002209]|uniref:DUF6230 family protein n=1 Tax=Streptomyces sp. NPDC002209 TaxID=3364638 RepID=UPI0036C46AB4